MTVFELVGVILALWVFVICFGAVVWLIIESTAQYAEALLEGGCDVCGKVDATERVACRDCEVGR